MTDADYDYVIVGGGTAGCVLASRLTEDSTIRVLLLEVGPKARPLLMEIPAGIGDLYSAGRFHWNYEADPETAANDKRLRYKMGRLLGGSSAINAMVYLRGHRADYDSWEAAGCEGWSFSDVEPYFQRLEQYVGPAGENMGTGGPIGIVQGEPGSNPLSAAFVEAAKQAGYPVSRNLSDGNQDGFGPLARNAKAGRRSDVYAGYLRVALRRPNLTVRTDTQARRLLVSEGRVTGVEFSYAGNIQSVAARREVVVSCGSLGTPHLLQVSGIGDPDQLSKLGIGCVRALPGVGKNLHTHPTIKFTFQSTQPVSIYRSTVLPGKWFSGLRWLLARDGPAASNHFEAVGFVRSDTEMTQPDMQLTFLPLALSSMTESISGHGFQVYMELSGVKSRGSISAVSSDVSVLPRFHFNFLEDERDRTACRRCVSIVRHLVSQPAFDPYRGEEITPGPNVQTEEQIDDWVREIVSVSHHLAGSCRMGADKDPDAVVNPFLQVRGIDNLRIVDASIMPTVVSANTHAAVIMIAEKAADMIRSRNSAR